MKSVVVYIRDRGFNIFLDNSEKMSGTPNGLFCNVGPMQAMM